MSWVRWRRVDARSRRARGSRPLKFRGTLSRVSDDTGVTIWEIYRTTGAAPEHLPVTTLDPVTLSDVIRHLSEVTA